MKDFIKTHRKEIDSIINSTIITGYTINDNDRREWIVNDEGLYQWARSEGVKV